MKYLCSIFLIICGLRIHAQEYVYVNTDSLLLRDRPEHMYFVYAVLHAPTRLEIINYDKGYADNKAVNARFCNVRLVLRNELGGNTFVEGWVEKNYVVRAKNLITWRGTDTSLDQSFRKIPVIPYIGPDKWDPNGFNCQSFPYPRFKGGERSFPAPAKRTYHLGPHGGCYYIGKTGRRNYVDPKYCR